VPILGGWGAKQNLFLSHVLQLFESLAQVIEVPLRHHRLRKVFCAHRRSCSDCTSELDTLDGAAQDKLEISDRLLERALRFVAPWVCAQVALCLIIPHFFDDVDCSIEHFLPVTIYSVQPLRGLLENPVDDIQALSNLSLAIPYLVLHFLHLVALFGDLLALISHIAPYECDQASNKPCQVN